MIFTITGDYVRRKRSYITSVKQVLHFSEPTEVLRGGIVLDLNLEELWRIVPYDPENAGLEIGRTKELRQPNQQENTKNAHPPQFKHIWQWLDRFKKIQTNISPTFSG